MALEAKTVEVKLIGKSHKTFSIKYARKKHMR